MAGCGPVVARLLFLQSGVVLGDGFGVVLGVAGKGLFIHKSGDT